MLTPQSLPTHTMRPSNYLLHKLSSQLILTHEMDRAGGYLAEVGGDTGTIFSCSSSTKTFPDPLAPKSALDDSHSPAKGILLCHFANLVSL